MTCLPGRYETYSKQDLLPTENLKFEQVNSNSQTGLFCHVWYGRVNQNLVLTSKWQTVDMLETHRASSCQIVCWRQGCSGAATRGDGVPPTFFRQGGYVPQFFGLKFVRTKVSPLLQLVSGYLLKRSVR